MDTLLCGHAKWTVTVKTNVGCERVLLEEACVCTYAWAENKPNPVWRVHSSKGLERQSENFTGEEGKLPWTSRCMKVQFVSHLFCFPSIRWESALGQRGGNAHVRVLWVHRSTPTFNLTQVSLFFKIYYLELYRLLFSSFNSVWNLR